MMGAKTRRRKAQSGTARKRDKKLKPVQLWYTEEEFAILGQIAAQELRPTTIAQLIKHVIVAPIIKNRKLP